MGNPLRQLSEFWPKIEEAVKIGIDLSFRVLSNFAEQNVAETKGITIFDLLPVEVENGISLSDEVGKFYRSLYEAYTKVLDLYHSVYADWYIENLPAPARQMLELLQQITWVLEVVKQTYAGLKTGMITPQEIKLLYLSWQKIPELLQKFGDIDFYLDTFSYFSNSLSS